MEFIEQPPVSIQAALEMSYRLEQLVDALHSTSRGQSTFISLVSVSVRNASLSSGSAWKGAPRQRLPPSSEHRWLRRIPRRKDCYYCQRFGICSPKVSPCLFNVLHAPALGLVFHVTIWGVPVRALDVKSDKVSKYVLVESITVSLLAANDRPIANEGSVFP